MTLQMLCLLILLMVASVRCQCSLNCTSGHCYATAEEALDCIYAVPYNQEWVNATLNVLVASLDNFGFRALYHNTGPPYNLQIDVIGELEAIRQQPFNNDAEFQEAVQSVLQSLQDAHTRYHKPDCYKATFVQPFVFELSIDPASDSEEPRAMLQKSVYTEQYSLEYPSVQFDDLIGKQVLLIDGLEFTTAVAGWSDAHETRSNNQGARFNSGLRSFLSRDAASMDVLPLTSLQLTMTDGTKRELPWLAQYSPGLGDVSSCAAAEEGEHKRSEPLHKQRMMQHDPPPALDKAALGEDRHDREVIVSADTPYHLSCFVQSLGDARGTGVERVLVMKVSSFSPPGDYQDAWTGFLGNAEQCLSVQYDMVVVDVMQNGGGYVCLGLRLLQLLVEEYYDDHTKVQMNYDLPHSPLMDSFIEEANLPNPYWDPQAVEEILDASTQESFPDGKAYYYPGRNVTQGGVTSWRTNFFSLDCREAEILPSPSFRPSSFMSPDRLIMLTDGTCGSTCASFTKIAQEAEKATFIGTGGLWGQPLDVSAFAGGFVCNPDYLWNIANRSGLSFPKFVTSQRWQFGWAAWYSALLPTRPVQFTEQEPDYRVPFWAFPHTSALESDTSAMMSALYDTVIHNTLQRLAETHGTDEDKSSLWIAIITIAVVAAVLAAALVVQFCKKPDHVSEAYGRLAGGEESHVGNRGATVDFDRVKVQD